MKRLVVLVATVVALSISIRAILSDPASQPTVEAAPSIIQEIGPTPVKEQQYKCKDNKVSAIFRLDEDGTFYRVFIQDERGQVDASATAWAANLQNPLWNPDCTWIGYTSGTPSAGFIVEVVNRNTLESKTFDLYTEFIDAVEGTSEKYTYGHMYTYLESWRDNRQMILRVVGRRDETDVQPEPLMFLVDVLSGRVGLMP